jgi:hypothetical protein
VNDSPRAGNESPAIPDVCAKLPVPRRYAGSTLGTICAPSCHAPIARPRRPGFNFGTWFVYDPATGQGGDGAFHPNSRLTPAKFSDGLSKTLCLAEVKAFTPYVRNTADPSSTYPAESPPSDAALVVGLATGMSAGDTKLGPTLTPNTRVTYQSGSMAYDFDPNSRQEGTSATAKTFAAITSRSHHRGLVTVAMMARSTATIADGVDATVWRALSTRSGGESQHLPRRPVPGRTPGTICRPTGYAHRVSRSARVMVPAGPRSTAFKWLSRPRARGRTLSAGGSFSFRRRVDGYSR